MDEFDKFYSKLRGGDPSVLEEFYRLAVLEIETVVRSRNYGNSKKVIDDQDIIQEVWRTFFRSRTSLPDLKSHDDLLRVIRCVARRQVRKQQRYLRANVRDQGKVSSLVQDPPSSVETASKELIARETYDRVVAGSSEEQRAVLKLRMAGLSKTDVARELGITEIQVRRLLSQLKNKLKIE